MTFKNLYEYVLGLNEIPIVLESRIVPKLQQLTGQDEILFVPVELDTGISYGHIKQYRRPGIPYSESKWVTEIRYEKNFNICWKRFICCKELMHLFDTAAERADSAAKLNRLLSELESPPPYAEASEMYKSETNTQWMALGVLCPIPLRERYRAEWAAKKITDYDVALQLRIPEAVVQSLMSPYFEAFIGSLVK